MTRTSAWQPGQPDDSKSAYINHQHQQLQRILSRSWAPRMKGMLAVRSMERSGHFEVAKVQGRFSVSRTAGLPPAGWEHSQC